MVKKYSVNSDAYTGVAGAAIGAWQYGHSETLGPTFRPQFAHGWNIGYGMCACGVLDFPIATSMIPNIVSISVIGNNNANTAPAIT
jgi:hypothetical protein